MHFKLKGELASSSLNMNAPLLFSFSYLFPIKRRRKNWSHTSRSAWKSAGWCASKVPPCVWTLVWSLGISLTRQGIRNSPKRARKWTTSCGLRCCFTRVDRCWGKGWQNHKNKCISQGYCIKILNFLVFSACVVAVKCRPVLHHCVVIFFWSSEIMDCMLLIFKIEFRSCARGRQ